ncbi:hypothetical protein D3P09_10115 [Paenibacillus pinisoli]|uniref:Uncharacterized protein n=1 Tax=Paenibacillus pinisoli TaxID=1276110 RepID=A0A3A6PJ48_9BACL|nr:hypothetical protein [Paenibacillus pinisoli]RJX39746.1 hypothetical protein D3P09_10115 [Paenibacillus pinisoli]
MKKIVLVMLCLGLFGIVFGNAGTQKAYASTAVIDSYVKIYSAFKATDGRIAIYYEMLQSFDKRPCAGGICINQDLTLEYTNILNQRQAISVNTTKGTHITYLPESKYVGNLVVNVRFNTTSYSEIKRHGVVFNYPSTVTVGFHTTTALEAVGSYVVQFTLPAIAFELFPQSRIIRVVAVASAGWATYSGITASVNAFPGLPQPVAGQYTKYTSWYTSDGNVNVKIEVFNSKAAYNNNDLPIYNSTFSKPVNY